MFFILPQSVISTIYKDAPWRPLPYKWVSVSINIYVYKVVFAPVRLQKASGCDLTALSLKALRVFYQGLELEEQLIYESGIPCVKINDTASLKNTELNLMFCGFFFQISALDLR